MNETPLLDQIRVYSEALVEDLPNPTTNIVKAPAPVTPRPAQRSHGWLVAVAAAALILVLVGGVAWLSRGGVPAADEPTTTTAPSPEVTTAPPTTAASTITEAVVVDRLGVRVPLDAPEQTRAEFLAGLDAEGWVSYTDEVVGWSIRYPADWTIGTDTEPGRLLVLLMPESDKSLTVTLGLDAAPGDVSSEDYHVGYLEAAVAAGVLYPPLDDQWYWVLDVDFDGRSDPQDITAVDLWRTVDAEGDPLLAGHPSGYFWSFAYYDPTAEPAYAYWFETFQGDPLTDTGMWPGPGRTWRGTWPELIMLSFEPPGGYP